PESTRERHRLMRLVAAGPQMNSDRRVRAPVTVSHSMSVRVLTGGGAQLSAFRLEDVVEAPFGKLDPGREPETPCLSHVMDDAAQSERPPRPADDVGVHRERDVFRMLGAALRIELVEIGLPGLEPVIGIAVFAVAVAEQRSVPERLPRQLDQELAVLLP